MKALWFLCVYAAAMSGLESNVASHPYVREAELAARKVETPFMTWHGVKYSLAAHFQCGAVDRARGICSDSADE